MSRSCSFDGCAKPHIARGFCATHYHRWRRHGDPASVQKHGGKPKYIGCSVPNCDKPHASKGYCRLHYERSRSDYPMDAPVRVYDPANPLCCRECVVPGCDRLRARKEMCDMHFKRQQRGDDLDAPLGMGRKTRIYTHNTATCSTEGCANRVYAKALCRIHYSRARYAIQMARKRGELTVP